MPICLAMLMILLNEPAAKQPNKQTSEKKITANVLINAGEPDPSWSITDTSDFEHLRNSLKDLPKTRKPRWPNLGWRGFLLVNQGVDDFPDEVQIFKGVILIVNGETKQYFKDEHRVEAWLASQASSRGILPTLMEKIR